MKHSNCACQDELIDVPDEPGIITEEAIQETPKKVVKEKKARKPNAWIVLCKEVQARPENAGKSYREVMKIAKLEYNK